MKLKPFKLAPGLIALGIIGLVCVVRLLEYRFRPQPGDRKAGLDVFERLERATYDMRARVAARHSPNVATNLGFVFINEASLKAVRNGALGYKYQFPWPRQVYGRLVEELTDQGARAVALDVIFGEIEPWAPEVVMADGGQIESDEFFARQMRRASNVIIAITHDTVPPVLFRDGALAVGDITANKDPDGILRRAQAFWYYTNWNLAFLGAKEQYGADLEGATNQPGKIILPLPGEKKVEVPLDSNGNFDWTDFVGDKIPEGHSRKEKPYTLTRAWHMGILLAARELGLNLDQAQVDLAHGRITLSGAGGIERVIPVDADGYFYIDWCIPPESRQLTSEAIHSLLAENKARLEGKMDQVTNRWQGRLAVVGSSAVMGNNLTDLGATPLEKETALVSNHWNIANTIITGRFIARSSLWTDLEIIAIAGLVAALLTWRLHVGLASALVALFSAAYIVGGFVVYTQTRYWLPLVLPVATLFATNAAVVTWRVLFEQADKRRVRSIFAKVVSPKIVQELLTSETLSLGGKRREITVLFADVRGFTAFTDLSQERVAEYVRTNKLSGAAAEDCYDETARDTLATVNLYLGLIADVIKKHDGTLDKFIGDCVMAFWGAPTSNSKHAVACVRAAIDAQRAMYELNQKRAAENTRLQLENLARTSAGLPTKPMLPILLLGTGINTGMATAGLMGSAQEERNYTVFGREVNLASRLESASGKGRIFIGTTTYQHLKRDDPELAATCVELPEQKLKGISAAVVVYEVPWRPPGASPLDEEFSTSAPSEGTTFTSFVQRGGT